MKIHTNRHIKTISKLLTIFLLIQFFCFETLPVMASTTPNITFSTVGKLLVGETIDILVEVNSIENLYGGSMDFVYDPSMIEIKSIEKGSLFNLNNVETPVKTFGNGNASISIILTDTNTSVSGSGTFALIKAKILKAGNLKFKVTDNSADLSLSDNTCRLKLSNAKNEKIPYNSTDRTLNLLAPIPLTFEEINTDKPSPQLEKTTIKISPKVSGGIGSLSYKFSIHDGNSWYIVQDYSPSSSYDWTPETNGNYTIKVDAMDEQGDVVSKELSYTITYPDIDILSLETSKPSPQKENTTIRVSPKTTGGSKNLSYRFWVLEGNAWSVVQDHSSKNYYDWTPTNPGNYKLWVDVMDKTSNNTGTIVSLQIPYTINSASLSIENIKTNIPSPSPAKTTIRITSESTSSGNLTYKFWILKEGTGKWDIVQDFSEKNYYDWTPDSPGNYKLWVDVKDRTGSMISKEIPYVVSEPLTISTINTDKNSPQLISSNIKITPSVTGGKGNYTYKFWVLKEGTGKWYVVQDFSSKNYYNWIPKIAGNYRLWVDVKDETGRMFSKEIHYVIDSFLFNSIETDKASPQLEKTQIKISPKMDGVNDNFSYKFWILKQGTGKWDVVQDFSTKNYYNWTPTSPGNYTLWVDIKDSTGNVRSKQIPYTVNSASLSITNITTDKQSPYPAKTRIRITSVAAGSGDLTYKFWVLKEGTGRWDVVQDFSSKNYYDWIPDSVGNYKLWVDVKDSTGNMISKDIPYLVSEPLTIASINTDKPSPELTNSKIRISPEIAGGMGKYTYKFWILKQGTGKWNVVQDFSSKTYYDWIPNDLGNYKLWVDVKDETGRIVSKEIPYTINSFIFNSIDTALPSPAFDKSHIKISANLSVDTSSLAYKFWILKQGTGKWDVVQDFSEKSYYDWNPQTAGNYTLWVDIKDKSGNMVSNQISYTIKPSPLCITGIYISESSPHPANDGIIIWPGAGGTGTVLYRFWIHDGNSWRIVQDFSTDEHYFWYPTKAGNYKIWVDVKDDSGNMVSSEAPFTITEPLTITSIDTDKTSPQLPNSTIRISPNTIGGKGDYSYKFSILKEGTGLWNVVQDFSSKDYFDWTPDTTGSYRLWVDVQDSTGNNTSKEISFTINSFLLNSIETSIPSPGVSNSPIRISANTSGENSSLQYKFWILEGNVWTLAQDFTSSSYYDWTPKNPGNYRIWVDVKSSDGTMVFKQIDYIVN